MKNRYFSHDCHARNDMKLQALLQGEGMAGIGIYWCLVEMLYEEDGELPTQYERIAKMLRCSPKVLKRVVSDYDLFTINCTSFWSQSALERLSWMAEKSDKARNSAKKRWDSHTNTDANALLGGNAIKETKLNKTKLKEENPYRSDTAFMEIWNLYPRKEGQKDALRHFRASVKTEQDFKDIKKAVENYNKSDRVLEGIFVKMGSTWFNNWREWIVPPVSGKQKPTGLAEFEALIEKGKSDRRKENAIA